MGGKTDFIPEKLQHYLFQQRSKKMSSSSLNNFIWTADITVVSSIIWFSCCVIGARYEEETLHLESEEGLLCFRAVLEAHGISHTSSPLRWVLVLFDSLSNKLLELFRHGTLRHLDMPV